MDAKPARFSLHELSDKAQIRALEHHRVLEVTVNEQGWKSWYEYPWMKFRAGADILGLDVAVIGFQHAAGGRERKLRLRGADIIASGRPETLINSVNFEADITGALDYTGIRTQPDNELRWTLEDRLHIQHAAEYAARLGNAGLLRSFKVKRSQLMSCDMFGDDNVDESTLTNLRDLCNALAVWMTSMLNRAYSWEFARPRLSSSAPIYNANGEPVFGDFLPSHMSGLI